MNVDHLHVVVTGAANGIGLAVSEDLIDAGASVTMMDANEPALHDAAAKVRESSGARAISIHVDVSSESEVRTAFHESVRRKGTIDAVVHLAGVMRCQGVDLPDVSLAEWQLVQDVNLTGTFLVAREAVHHIRASGTIMVASSAGGVLHASGSIPYGASKAGVHGLVLSLQESLHASNIRVVELIPGVVDTPLLRASLSDLENAGQATRAHEIRARAIPPAAIASTVRFLISPNGQYVRGIVTVG